MTVHDDAAGTACGLDRTVAVEFGGRGGGGGGLFGNRGGGGGGFRDDGGGFCGFGVIGGFGGG
ncbi:MAG: hypothetical protein ABJK54_04565, partial [Alphaproteobacteria bacterium]